MSRSFAVTPLSSDRTKKSLICSRQFLRRRRGGNFRVFSKEIISTRRLDEIEECQQADFIKSDVRGAELLVLENALQKISNAVVIETEVEFVEIYRNQPLFGDIQRFMRDQGFVLHKLVDISGRNFRPMSTRDPTQALSQFFWANAVFVKEHAKIGDYSPEQMLKAAVILHEIYLSYDLVHILLYAHDFATHSEYATKYRDEMGKIKNLPRQFANVRRQL